MKLKKQSQCQNRQNSIKPVLVMIYVGFCGYGRFWAAKNKANRRPSAGNLKSIFFGFASE
jgi:hypothetical protein